MQKTCKTKDCSRKADQNCFSQLCPPCSNAAKSSEAETKRRLEYLSRQQSARANSHLVQRDLRTACPPPPPLTIAAAPQPNQAQAQAVNPNIQSLPQCTTQPTPDIDVNRLYQTFQNMEQGAAAAGPDNSAPLKDMFGMLLHLCSKSTETEEMKTVMSSNTQRLDRLEAKLGGNPDDIAVPLSVAIRNLPLPAPGSDDLQLVKAVFQEINARGFDIDRDITKVVRQGASEENLGTVMVELKSDDARASIMKTKKVLENHNNPGMRKLIIKNMKPRLELKVDIALSEMLKKFPGGENFYVANNGHIREKNVQQRTYQNTFNRNPLPNQTPLRTQTCQVNQQPRPQQPTLGAIPKQPFTVPPPQSIPPPLANPITFPTWSMPLLASIPGNAPHMFTGASQFNPLLTPRAQPVSYLARPPAPLTSAPPTPMYTGMQQLTPLLTSNAPLITAGSSQFNSVNSEIFPSADPAVQPVHSHGDQSILGQANLQPAVSTTASSGHPAVSLPTSLGHHENAVSQQ